MVEVRKMTGIGIPPIDPGTGVDGSLWPGIVAAVALAVVFGAAVWTYVRNRPTRPTSTERRDDEFHLSKAA
jgi:hypothetical protein